MSIKVIEKRDNDTTIAILDDTIETGNYTEPICASYKSNQSPYVNQYLSKESERKNLIVKPIQKDVKSYNSLENKINRMSNTLPIIQAGRKQSIQNYFNNKDPEKIIKKFNTPQPIKKCNASQQINKKKNEIKAPIDLNKAENKQETMRPTTPQIIRNSNESQENQTPRKSISSRNQHNSDKTYNEEVVLRPTTPQIIRNSNELQTNQTLRKSISSRNQHNSDKTENEIVVLRPATPQIIRNSNESQENQTPRKSISSRNKHDSDKTYNEKVVLRPTTPQYNSNLNEIQTNQTPRKSISSRNQHNSDKTENEIVVLRPATPQIIRNSNESQENQTHKRFISSRNQVNCESEQILNKERTKQTVVESNKKISNSSHSSNDSSVSTPKRNVNRRHQKLFKRCDLLPPPLPSHENKITLVLDLDETLVHSVFCYMSKCDFSFKADQQHFVSVRVRPGVKDFIVQMGNLYELVLFTVGNNAYATRIIDFIDPNHMIKYRLYRESCTVSRGLFVKDLSRLGREMNRIIILDDSPSSYRFQPYNALPISSWIGDPKDNELIQIQNFLTENHQVNNVYSILFDYRSKYMASQNNENKNII